MKTITWKGVLINNGDKVTGFISGTSVDGVIEIHGAGTNHLFWQNIKNGGHGKGKFGYNYAWSFSEGDPQGVVITKNYGSSGTKSDSRPYLEITGIGKLYHGDYIKVKVDAYKPKILFKCKLVIHDGKFYLNNDKIGSSGIGSVPKFNYPLLWAFSHISPGRFTDTVSIKELVERGEVESLKISTISSAISTSSGVSYSDNYKSEAYPDTTYPKEAPKITDHNIFKPKTTETPVKLVIPRRRLLRLNQDL